MELSKVSDSKIKSEYIKRFAIEVGEMIDGSGKASDHFRQYIIKDREVFMIAYLNGSNGHICTEVSPGTINHGAVYPRELLKSILAHNASAIILAHNHPSGAVSPSKEDRAITKRVKEICDLINVALHDHLILTHNGDYSFADHGLI